jgi:phage gp45-like
MSDLEARVAMLERMVTALSRRQGASIAFSRSTAPPIDTGPVQTIQGQMDALSNRDAMPVLFHYGYSSAMPVGGDKVVGYLNGTRSSPVVIATGHQTYRMTGLATGEVVIYDMWGRSIKMGASGITINGGGKVITITNSPTLIQNGDIHATGAVIAGYGGADQVGLQTHKHPVPNVAGGTGTATSTAPSAGT